MADTLLSVAPIMKEAEQQAGSSDYGERDFVTPLQRLLDSLNAEADLSDSGALILRQLFVQILVNRLRFEADRKRYPEILVQELPPPIIVLGLPRSGTTKLHRVLSAHPGLQFLPLWQILNPAPTPGPPANAEDPRIAYAQATVDAMAENFTDTVAAHPMSATGADEEAQYLMEMTFDGPLLQIRAHIPEFSRWRWERSMLPCYNYLKKMLQYIQWQNPDTAGSRPFVLKTPMHLGHINELFEVFPGATIVHCHRDPIKSVPSFARLIEAGWNMVGNPRRMRDYGDCALETMHTHMHRYLEQRNDLGAAGKFVDVKFEQIVDNSIEVASRCFAAHNLPMDDSIAHQIVQWERDNPATKYGDHVYSLERYDLSQAEIRDRFAAYYQAFSSSF